LAKQLEAAGPALRSQLQHAVRELVLTAGDAAAVAIRQRQASQRAAVISIASACVVIVVALAAWLARP
jgi:flagellar biosynthesis/type III secretory pathway M-ring protein FliF/YscJ